MTWLQLLGFVALAALIGAGIAVLSSPIAYAGIG